MSAAVTLWLEDDIPGVIKQAATVLAAGAVIVFPTDTVYGLLAAITPASGYKMIYQLKQRSRTKPLQLLVNKQHAVFKEASLCLAKLPQYRTQFASGRLTIVLSPATLPALPSTVKKQQPGNIGLRCPAETHPVQQLLQRAEGLLWASSANRSGSPPAVTANDVMSWANSLAQPPGLIVLTNLSASGQPSTILDLACS